MIGDSQPNRRCGCPMTPSASASRSTSSRDPTWNGTAPDPEDQRLDPERRPRSRPAPGPGRPCRPAGRPATPRASSRRARPGGVLARSRSNRRARSASSSPQQRVEPERAPHRLGVAPGPVARRVACTSSRSRYASGSRPSRCSSRRPGRPRAGSAGSPLPPTNTGGRGACTAGGRLIAPSARWNFPSNVHGPPSGPSSCGHDLDRFGEPGEAHARAAGSPSRSPRTRARTNPRRARRRADRR